jgi:hypothetical protein
VRVCLSTSKRRVYRVCRAGKTKGKIWPCALTVALRVATGWLMVQQNIVRIAVDFRDKFDFLPHSEKFPVLSL